MRLLGPAFLERFGGRTLNSHPALLPAFPGMHGPRDALAYGVKITGATVFLVDAGVDTGVIVDQVAVPVEDSDTRRRPARADQDRRARAAGRDRPPPGHPALAGHRPKGALGTMSESRGPAADPTGAGVGVRQDRPRPDRRALVDAGVELVSTGSTARTLVEAGLPVTPVEQVTGFPECLDGRVKTLHPRVHAGLLADLRLDSHGAARELGIAPFELLISNLYPFRETVASGAIRRMRRADRHRRAGDGAGRGQEPRQRRGDHLAGPVRRRCARRSRPAASPWPSGRRWPHRLRPHRQLRRRRRRLAGPGAERTSRAPGSRPGPGQPGRGRPCCATGRTRTSGGALSRPQAGGLAAAAEQLHGKEMSYNNYVDADAARRTAYDFDDPAVAIIKHANPCGIAVGADIAEAHRRAHACDPVSAFGGVIAANRPVSAAMAGQIAEVFTEVVVAPAYDDDAVEILTAKKNIRLLEAEPYRRRANSSRRHRRRHPGPVPRRGRRRPRSGANWKLVAGDAGRRGPLADLEFAWAAVPGGQVQRHPARPGRRLGRGRHGPGEPGRLVPAGGAAGGGAGGRVGGRLRRLLPVRRRPADADRRRRRGDRAAGRLGARRRGDRRGPGSRASPCTSPVLGTSTTDCPLAHAPDSARR